MRAIWNFLTMSDPWNMRLVDLLPVLLIGGGVILLIPLIGSWGLLVWLVLGWISMAFTSRHIKSYRPPCPFKDEIAHPAGCGWRVRGDGTKWFWCKGHK